MESTVTRVEDQAMIENNSKTVRGDMERVNKRWLLK